MSLGGANHTGRGGNPPLCAGHDPRHAARAAILIVAIAMAAALLAPGGWDGHAPHDAGSAWPFGAAHAQQADSTSFKTTWKTDSANEEITLPVRGSGITIYWGDGTNSTGVSGDAAHTYAAAGNHTISVSGGLTGIFLNGDEVNAPKLVSIDQWGNASWTTMDSAFKGAEIMVYNATDTPDLSAVTNMTSMFENAYEFNGNISTWNVSSVTDMDGMFIDASSFNQDISSWDVSQVTDMTDMFIRASSFDQDISTWDVSRVTDMDGMFYASSFNQDISSWNVSQVTDMTAMFSQTSFNQNLTSWDVSQVTDMGEMFSVSSFNSNISTWDVSSVTSMSGMFAESSFNQDISTWNVSSVTDITYMFEGASFNQDISTWNVSLVTNMRYMFATSSFSGNISSWNVSSVTDMNNMFSGAASFNQDISTWDVSSVTDMTGMFGSATSFNQDISAWNVSQVTRMPSMFSGATSFNQDISAWNVSSVNYMSAMFTGASAFSQNLGSWYVVLDDTTISVGVETLEIRAQNAFLEGQKPIYMVNDTSFVFNDNGLLAVNFTNPPSQGIHPVNITATGPPFGTGNSIVTEITVDADDFSKPFVTTWRTDSANQGVTIPFVGSDININWGDGNLATSVLGTASHTFAAAGRHTVSVSGLTGISLSDHADAPKLVSIDQWGDVSWTSMRDAFRGASNMVYRAADTPDLSAVTSMASMFSGASSFNGNISTWNVSQVTRMPSMFQGAVSFNQDISAWNVSSVTSMASMFSGASSFNRTLSTWDVSSVTSMASMFSGASSFNRTLSAWDVSSVTSMASMFSGATSFDQDLNDWDVSAVRNMAYMFSRTAFNGNISTWDVSSVTDMSRMFSNDNSFNGNISAWNVSSVTDTSFMFESAAFFNQDLNDWDVSAVRNMASMFSHAARFHGNISTWNVSSVTDMSFTFDGNTFNGNISTWDVSQVTTMNNMFQDASFDQDISAWNVSSVTSTDNMFSGASSFNQDISAWNVSSVTSTSAMFAEAASFNQDISAWNVSAVQNMYRMFEGASSFDQDISAWNVSSAMYMNKMFEGAASFNQDISSWNVSSVTHMADMFERANKFNQNLGRWYVTLSSATIRGDAIPGVVGSVSAQNAFLDGQGPAYGIGIGGNSTRFSVTDDNMLNMTTAAEGKTSYTVNITAAGSVFEDGNNWRTVEVTVRDTTDPVITITGGTPVSITAGSTYSDRGATCRDETDGDLTSSITATSTVVASTAGTYQVTYTCTDSAGNSAQAIRTVLVTAPNTPPTAEAGPAQAVNEGSTVTLAGTATGLDHADTLTYSWFQTSPASPAVTFGNSSALSTTFTAPQVTADTAFTFTLSVTDGTATVTDTVTVTVRDVPAPNTPPTVDAGPAQTANEDQTVTLAGTATDLDHADTLTYSWFQTSPASPTVSLGDPASLTTNFTAPPVTADTAFTFTLSVSDGTDTSTDTVTVTVEARSDKAGSRSKTWTVDDMVGIMGGKGQHDLELISRCDEGTDPTSASTELHLLGLLGQASYGTFNVDMETTWVWIIEAYRLAYHYLDTGKDVISEDVYEDGITLDQYIDAAPGDVFEYPDGNYTKAQLGSMTAWSASIDWTGDGSCSLDFRQETWVP